MATERGFTREELAGRMVYFFNDRMCIKTKKLKQLLSLMEDMMQDEYERGWVDRGAADNVRQYLPKDAVADE